MPAIKMIAWIHFGLAALLTYMALYGNFGLLPPAIAVAIAGCLFIAIDKGLTLLTEIRDRLPEPSMTIVEPEHVTTQSAPTRSLAELDADLQRLKGKNA